MLIAPPFAINERASILQINTQFEESVMAISEEQKRLAKASYLNTTHN